MILGVGRYANFSDTTLAWMAGDRPGIGYFIVGLDCGDEDPGDGLG